VARELRKAGWPNARAILGGWSALESGGWKTLPKELTA
jgi:hypothetical protein